MQLSIRPQFPVPVPSPMGKVVAHAVRSLARMPGRVLSRIVASAGT